MLEDGLVLEAEAGTLVVAGTALGVAVYTLSSDRLSVVSVGAGVRALLLLPLVAVVPQPQTAKNSSSVSLSNAPFSSTSPVDLL